MKKYLGTIALAFSLACFVVVIWFCAHQLGLIKGQTERVMRRAKEYQYYLELEEQANLEARGVETFNSEGICERLQQSWASGTSSRRYSPEMLRPPGR